MVYYFQIYSVYITLCRTIAAERETYMKIIIIGAGKVGKKIADQLILEDHDIIIIDNDINTINSIMNNQDVMCIHGNGAHYEVQLEAGVDTADVLIAASPFDEVNMLCCLIAKKLGAKRCIARVRTPEYYRQIGYIKDDLGLSIAVNPEFAAASEIARVLLLSAASKIEVFANGRIELVEFKISETSPLAGHTLADIYKKFKVKFLVCIVQRDKKIIIPDGSFIPQVGDRISIASNHAEAEKFFKKTETNNDKIKSVMIIGGGRIGYYLAKQLSEIGMTVKIIESDYNHCLELSELLSGVTIINADGTDHNVLKEEGIESADAFAALTGIDEENMIMSIYARNKNVSKVVAKVNRGSYLNIANNIGLDSVVSPKQLAANNILGYIRAMKNSEHSNNIETIYKLVDGRAEALEFVIREETDYTGKTLRELKTRKDVIIAGIVRNRRTIIPNGDDTLEVGDSVIVVSAAEILDDLDEIFI